MTGTVKWYSDQKGYGFIAAVGGDVFFHVSHVVGREWTPKSGDAVTFDTKLEPRGSAAVNVRLLTAVPIGEGVARG